MGSKQISQNPRHKLQNHLFPIFLKLKDKLCVIIGGGKVAQRKAQGLIKCGAKIKVVSPTVEDPVKRWASKGLLTWYEKKFTAGDLGGAFMAFVATDNHAENKKAVRICNKKGIIVNVVDKPEQCDFFIPSVVRRKSLAIAISTEGKSPMFARRMCEELEKIITDEYGEFLNILGEQREYIKKEVPDITRRNKIIEQIIYSDIFTQFKSCKTEQIKEFIEQCISSLQD